jgi:predicted porin
MKKHLIAAAVAAAVAVPAMAQNVEIYGILDQGYRDSSVTFKEADGDKLKRDSKSSIQGGTYTTQRLGFRGTEDLGGGLKASFNYEVGLGGSGSGVTNAATIGGNDTGADSGTTDNNIVTRQANVGISGGFGSIKVGQMTTQAENAWLTGDVGGGNNLAGRAYVAGSGLKLSNARSSRLIEYVSPTMNGFTVAIQYGKGSDKIDNDTAATLAEKNDSHKEVGASLRYAAGPLAAMVGYSSERTKSGDYTTAKPKELVLGANYNFGPATAFFIYADGSDETNGSGLSTTGRTLSLFGATVIPATAGLEQIKTDNKVMEVGVRVPLGAVNLQASYFDGRTKYKLDGVAGNIDKDGYQLAALYNFSKRTMGYAVYGTQDWKGKKAFSGIKGDNDQLGIGIRHSF